MVGFVTDAGLASNVAAWAAVPAYLQCGSGSGQTDSSNDLASPLQTRDPLAASQQTTVVIGDTLQLQATFTANSVLQVTEVGVFDAVIGGNMDIYGDFTAIPLANGDSIQFTISVQVE